MSIFWLWNQKVANERTFALMFRKFTFEIVVRIVAEMILQKNQRITQYSLVQVDT